jgi:maltooligosyltrehalose trehalohydrolase
MSVLLLAPSPPLLFMGEEFGAATPFLFFCDFGPDLAPKVTQGRRSEFAKFAQFNSRQAQAQIPDPSSPTTFAISKLDWDSLEQPAHREWLQFYRHLLSVRQREIVPRIRCITPGNADYKTYGGKALSVSWPLRGGGGLSVCANFSEETIRMLGTRADVRVLHSEPGTVLPGELQPPFSAIWMLNE